MKKKVFSLLLAAALFLSVLLFPIVTAAEGNIEEAQNGFITEKTATPNDDGTYTIQLDSYGLSNVVKTKVPTDFVLVLDQSGSMDDAFGVSAYSAYIDRTNLSNYTHRHNNNSGNANLYYFSETYNAYYPVSVTRSALNQVTEGYVAHSDWQFDDIQNYSGDIYVLKNGHYFPVTIIQTYNSTTRSYTITYSMQDGSSYIWTSVSSSYYTTKKPALVDHLKCDNDNVYTLEEVSDYNYTYAYTRNNRTVAIGTSQGNNTEFETDLYRRNITGDESPRLEGLQYALRFFLTEVGDYAVNDEDGTLIDHRVAIVGFASGDNDDVANDNWYYENTELFDGDVAYQYDKITQEQYASAFKSAHSEEDAAKLLNALYILDGSGATCVDLGLEMATKIFDAYQSDYANGNRNKVVIVFTDGNPGSGRTRDGYGRLDQSSINTNISVANTALQHGTALKNAGVTLYTIGIFEGADPTSKGSSDTTGDATAEPAFANYFLQRLSSNNGQPPQNGEPSYYLSATNEAELKSIFVQIAEEANMETEIDEGRRTYALRDVVTDQFEIVPGTGSRHSAPCTGVDNDGNYVFGQETLITDTDWDIRVDDKNSSVIVIGYDYYANAVRTIEGTDGESDTYQGNKLIIRFKVKPKNGFLGGNQVLTNDSENTGIYEHEDGDLTNPNIIRVAEFPEPVVDVPIGAVSVTAPDFNEYLLGEVTGDEIKNGLTVKVGNNSINLALETENYGLAKWQNEYVDITITYTDSEGNSFTALEDLTDDKTYTVSVTVSPKNAGTATAQTGRDEGNIYVYKPTLTYKDTDVWYGDTAPVGYTGNLVETKWVHGTQGAAPTAVMGQAPALTMEYALVDSSDISDSKINSKQDVPINVTSVKIDRTDVTGNVTFAHDDCKQDEGLQGGKFLLHPQTCTLTVTKTGGEAGEPYVFTVNKDGAAYTQLTIVGNKSVTLHELPVGTYTVTEDSKWSWRYSATVRPSSATLSSTNPNGTLNCNNTRASDIWLNTFSDVICNIFGISKSN